MTAVFHRDLSHDYPVAVRGSGMYLIDDTGKNYLDMSGGAAVSCLGHGRRDILDAIHGQIEKLAYAHTAFFSNAPQEQLAERLIGRFGDLQARAYFTSGGSEANELAINLSWRYWQLFGATKKTKIISRQHSYHGMTLGALSLSGNPARRAGLENVLINWPQIDPCYAYRHQKSGESEADYATRCAQSLEAAILKEGPDTIAAFIAEPVVGASLGAAAAPSGYFQQIRAICDKYDVLLILDEIMCGIGRTGSYFAFEQEGIRPDIVTMAKGIGGGYLPLAATLVSAKISTAFEKCGAMHPYGHTYMGHASACAAGVAVYDAIERENLVDRVAKNGPKLQDLLLRSFGQHPNIGDIRGRGYFRALEIVSDRETKTPVADPIGLAKRIRQSAMAHGLICYPSGGMAEDGGNCHILLAPPFIAEDIHFEELAEKLTRVLVEELGG